MGSSHNSENPYEGYTILFSIQGLSRILTRNSDPISAHYFDNKDDR